MGNVGPSSLAAPTHEVAALTKTVCLSFCGVCEHSYEFLSVCMQVLQLKRYVKKLSNKQKAHAQVVDAVRARAVVAGRNGDCDVRQMQQQAAPNAQAHPPPPAHLRDVGPQHQHAARKIQALW